MSNQGAFDTGPFQGGKKGKHGHHHPHPPPHPPPHPGPPPPPTPKPAPFSRVALYSVLDYRTLDLSPFTDAFWHVPNALLWASGTPTLSALQGHANAAKAAAPGKRLHAVSWAFGPGSVGIGAATEASWVQWCENVYSLMGLGVFSGFALDCEIYPEAPHPFRSMDMAAMARRGQQFAQAVTSAGSGGQGHEVALMAPFWQQHQPSGAGTPPEAGFYAFANALPAGYRAYAEESYSGISSSGLATTKATLIGTGPTQLHAARLVPGIWPRPSMSAMDVSGARGGEMWVYVQAASPAEPETQTRAAFSRLLAAVKA